MSNDRDYIIQALIAASSVLLIFTTCLAYKNLLAEAMNISLEQENQMLYKEKKDLERRLLEAHPI